ncbi:sugar ABC transporter ATPase [Microbacterium sp. NPDC057407]|uniref:sugar ABC transporter ATPase n=1 Tax=Microbacterium sp. NPDC057407 TaxID=3346120 RepID=UPI003672DF13
MSDIRYTSETSDVGDTSNPDGATSDLTPGEIPPAPDGQVGAQPLRDGDTSIEPDPTLDPAQAEWDRTTALEEGVQIDELDAPTATGDDPAHISDERDQIPATDRPGSVYEPETQGLDMNEAVLGDEGQGDLAPEDL